jgi:hypothetical protein
MLAGIAGAKLMVGTGNVGLKTEATMTIGIDGDWSALEFAQVLALLSDLYVWFVDGYAVLGVLEITTNVRLEVDSIKYGSPGQLSVVGLGEVMKQIKELIMYLMDRDLHREELARKNELLKVIIEDRKAQKRRWDNIERFFIRHYSDGADEKLLRFKEDFEGFIDKHEAMLENVTKLSRARKLRNIKIREDGGGSELEPV